MSYRYGVRGGPRGVCKTSWARAPFRRKNAENEVLPPVRKRILILCGQKKRLRLHFQRFCGPPCRSFLRSRCESSPQCPTRKSSSPPKGRRNLHSWNAARECEPFMITTIKFYIKRVCQNVLTYPRIGSLLSNKVTCFYFIMCNLESSSPKDRMEFSILLTCFWRGVERPCIYAHNCFW